MKICYITDLFPPYDKGGAERIAFYEAEMMAKEGHEVTVITTTNEKLKDSKGYEVKISKGIKVYYFSPVKKFSLNPYLHTKMDSLLKKTILMFLSLYNPYSHLIINRILEKEKPDIVHAHYTYFISYGALRAVDLKKTKLIITFHMYHYECPKGGLLRKGIIREKLEICNFPPLICRVRNGLFKAITPEPSAIIAISKYIKGRLEERGFKNVIYLPNGVSIRDSADTSYEKEILYVGRLSKAKGVHLLINAFNNLQLNRFNLRIIGDGEDREYFESLAGSNKNILFMGKLSHEEVNTFYKKAFVVVVPSIWYEVMNTVVCEAMAHGKPVIASDVPGTTDMIINGETGILFPVGNVDELTQALNKIIRDTQLTQNMGKKAKEKIKEFSEQKHLERLLNVYHSVLQG